MKFRAIAATDLLVSEVAFDLDGLSAAPDVVLVERLVRLAYDEGINLFLVSNPLRLGGALGAAFGGDRRAKVSIAIRESWTGDFDRFSRQLDADLAGAGIDRAELLFISGVEETDLSSGAVGDAVHRLRASGRVGHAGFGRASGFLTNVSLIERNGFAVAEERPLVRRSIGDDRALPAVVKAPALESSENLAALAFLWQDTGRTASQTAVQLALSMPGVCSVAVPAASAIVLKEFARAPLAPALLPDEIVTAWEALLRPAEAVAAPAIEAVGA